MSRRRRRKWPWVVLLLALAGFGVWWQYFREGTKEAPPEYETHTVARGDLRQEVQATGELNPLVKIEIGSQISGTIYKLNVDFNSEVKEGDVLCELDPATYEANYAQAVAEKLSIETELALNKRTLERKQLLLDKKLFAQADFDKAEADLRRSEAQLALAEAKLKKVKIDLDRCKIYAPRDGVITDRTAEIGQTIAASFNAPKLFVMANDLTKMQINAKVNEAFVGQVKPGQKVRFVVDAYKDEFTGTVDQIRNSPITEENVVNYDAIIAVNNPELKLKPGMTATVYIIVGERTGVLSVPNSALRFRPPLKDKDKDMAEGGGRPGGDRGGRGPGGPGGDGEGKRQPGVKPKESDEKQVWLPPSTPTGDPTPVKVKVGLRNELETEILEGLKEGDVIIKLLKPPSTDAGGATNPFGGMGRRRR